MNSVLILLIYVLMFSNSQCLNCHDGVVLSGVHRDMECTNCHSDIQSLPHRGVLKKVECGSCHEDVDAEYKQDIHYKFLLKGEKGAPDCKDCHGTHEILSPSDVKSPLSNKEIFCAKCHQNVVAPAVYHTPKIEDEKCLECHDEEIRDKLVHSSHSLLNCTDCHEVKEIPHRETLSLPKCETCHKNEYLNYKESVHYQAILNNKKGAFCSDCHGAHDIYGAKPPKSKININNIPGTCSDCHQQEYKDYIESVHWKGLLSGSKDSPVCTDCHAAHKILSSGNPESPIYPLNIPKSCSYCHENPVLIERYNLSSGILDSYYKSYHGVALRGGNPEAANCASCHESHRVLPPSNSLSSVHPDNLPKTCAGCHPGVKPTAKIQSVHKIKSRAGYLTLNIVRGAYILLIIVTIGGMIVYCLLDLIKKAREGAKPHFKESTRQVLRFNKFERGVHLAHLISFIVLVYTGFIHHYPDALWGHWLAGIWGGALRAYIHRIAGSLMLIAFGITVFGMIFTRRGREQFLEILLKPKDIKDAIQLFFYNLGLVKERPKFGRFTFYEKIEFWALVWGTIVMGVTGLALWFKTQTLNLLPNWFIELFLAIHFYEAILASLAILVWHFYWVIFDPIFYPLNKAMFTGTLPEEIYREEHTLEFESEETFDS